MEKYCDPSQYSAPDCRRYLASGLGSLGQLAPAGVMAEPAAVSRVHDDTPGGVADQAGCAEDACPQRFIGGVHQDRPDMAVLDESLECRDAVRRGIGEFLHLPGQVRPVVAGAFGEVAASDPHVEAGLSLPEHAGVADPGYHDDDLARRQLATVLPRADERRHTRRNL